jgi:hypothetical protein
MDNIIDLCSPRDETEGRQSLQTQDNAPGHERTYALTKATTSDVVDLSNDSGMVHFTYKTSQFTDLFFICFHLNTTGKCLNAGANDQRIVHGFTEDPSILELRVRFTSST